MLLPKNKDESREVVLKVDNVGVAFQEGYRKDDYKSKVIDLFKNNNDSDKKDTLVWPLRNISFEGYKGEILGLIGHNGAGKTTLCKMISGILQPDEGDIKVDGKVSALFSLGMGFNKELTGRENVYLNGMMLGISQKQINTYIDDIVEFAELGQFIDQPMKYYSSGMKARLGFSVAAHLEPEILILDEALNTGDVKFGRKAAEKMKELVKRAKMVILVTHSLRYAERNCDRLIWLERGGIREIGDPAEIVERYQATLPPKKKQLNKKLDLQKTETDVKDDIVVKAEDLSVSYKLKKDRFWALKNLDFEIHQGEVVGIIGHNGAGKSTLCKVLTNILAPEEGAIQLNGDTTALLSYGTGFNAQLSGRDNIFLNGMLLGIPKKRVERDYPEIVRFSELEKAIDKPVKQYSSGMKARLGFSIAATLKPDIFIIDEALSTGDIAFQQKASERIQEMMEQAKAVIIVSHSMKFVEQVCTRAIWMERGQIKMDGEAEEVVKAYRATVRPKRKTKKKTGTAAKKKTSTSRSGAGTSTTRTGVNKKPVTKEQPPAPEAEHKKAKVEQNAADVEQKKPQVAQKAAEVDQQPRQVEQSGKEGEQQQKYKERDRINR